MLLFFTPYLVARPQSPSQLFLTPQPSTPWDGCEFEKFKPSWSDGQIVEIVAMIALFGFLNRWNDTLATPLEDEALALGEKYLAPHGWDAGRHLRSV